MHRFFCPNFDLASRKIILTDSEEVHHLVKVLRLKKDDEICFFNGKGEEAFAKISSIKPDGVTSEVISVKKASEKFPRIILACAIPKKSKFEIIVEKATELGADEIIPLLTRRTEVNLKGARAEGKKKRFETIALNAAKQSKRSIIPMIHPPVKFETAVKDLAAASTVIIPSLSGERENLFLALSKIPEPKSISILIGPEGDFTPEEYEFTRANNCLAVSLGETVLKVETAAICTLSCLNVYYEKH